MAWIATETFESYSAGNNLNTLSGGSGWSGNWASPSQGTIQTAPSGMTGLVARWVSTTDGIEANRTFSPVAGTAELIFKIQLAQTNAACSVRLNEAGTAERITIQFDGSGNINANGTFIQTYSANTTYVIGIKYGHNGNNFQIAIDGGSYSSDIGMSGSTINNFLFGPQVTTSMTFYIDEIGPGPYSPVGAVAQVHSTLLTLGCG